jgi:hypothetical protein
MSNDKQQVAEMTDEQLLDKIFYTLSREPYPQLRAELLKRLQRKEGDAHAQPDDSAGANIVSATSSQQQGGVAEPRCPKCGNDTRQLQKKLQYRTIEANCGGVNTGVTCTSPEEPGHLIFGCFYGDRDHAVCELHWFRAQIKQLTERAESAEKELAELKRVVALPETDFSKLSFREAVRSELIVQGFKDAAELESLRQQLGFSWCEMVSNMSIDAIVDEVWGDSASNSDSKVVLEVLAAAGKQWAKRSAL